MILYMFMISHLGPPQNKAGVNCLFYLLVSLLIFKKLSPVPNANRWRRKRKKNLYRISINLCKKRYFSFIRSIKIYHLFQNWRYHCIWVKSHVKIVHFVWSRTKIAPDCYPIHKRTQAAPKCYFCLAAQLYATGQRVAPLPTVYYLYKNLTVTTYLNFVCDQWLKMKIISYYQQKLNVIQETNFAP